MGNNLSPQLKEAEKIANIKREIRRFRSHLEMEAWKGKGYISLSEMERWLSGLESLTDA